MSDFIESEADESEDDLFATVVDQKKSQKHQEPNDGRMIIHSSNVLLMFLLTWGNAR